MSKTVVGLFSSMSKAEEVKKALLAQGYSASIVANNGGIETSSKEADSTAVEGIGQKVSNFFHGLTGGDEDVHTHYAEGVNADGALVGVTCSDDQATEVSSMLKQYGAREVQNKMTAGANTPTAYNASANTDETVIPIVEEELQVGKREVDRGGVRIYSHVVERPVTADVTLHEEKILVERRPVNRMASAADFNMGQGSIELNATGEEAVVGKTARVVEEVMVGKTSTSHTEVIEDSVRKTEVEVEQLPGTPTSTDRY